MIASFFASFFWYVVSVGGLVAAVALWGFMTKIRVPSFIQVPLVCLCVGVSGFGLGYIQGSDRTKDELAAVNAKLRADAAIASDAARDAERRLTQIEGINDAVEKAENLLDRHPDDACGSAADDLERLRSILQDFGTAEPSIRSDGGRTPPHSDFQPEGQSSSPRWGAR